MRFFILILALMTQLSASSIEELTIDEEAQTAVASIQVPPLGLMCTTWFLSLLDAGLLITSDALSHSVHCTQYCFTVYDSPSQKTTAELISNLEHLIHESEFYSGIAVLAPIVAYVVFRSESRNLIYMTAQMIFFICAARQVMTLYQNYEHLRGLEKHYEDFSPSGAANALKSSLKTFEIFHMFFTLFSAGAFGFNALNLIWYPIED